MVLSMAKTTTQTVALREDAVRHIEENRIAGRDTRHNRATNLQAIRGLVNGEPHYTFGIKGVERFSFDEVLDAVASITKCSRDPNVTTGGGYISPTSTLTGLEQAAQRISSVARRGGKVLLGTGHPGSLLLYYVELGQLIRHWGGEVLEPENGAFVPPNLDLDYIRGVAVTTDRASLMHSHDYRAMEIMLNATPAVDLAVADHGYAGAAINAGIPVVTVMDTNDPAVAVAKRMGADAIVVPMDDNRPLSSYLTLIELLQEFVEAPESAAYSTRTSAQSAAQNASTLLEEMRDRLRVAERLLDDRAGPTEALDEMAWSLLEGYRDQFLQTHFALDEDERLRSDPALELALYKRLHDALRRAAIERLQLSQPNLDPDEIVGYLEGKARGTPPV